MKKEELIAAGLTDEQADTVFAMNGKDIEKYKNQLDTAKADNADLKGQLEARDKDIADLKATASSAEDYQKKLAELETKYTTETEALTTKLADRDYSDAITRAVTGAGIKFSSKAAEKAYIAELKEKKLEVKGGLLAGFDDFHKAQMEADPAAFMGDKPAPFVKPIGKNEPPAAEGRAAAFAKSYGAQFSPPTNTTKE